MIKSRERHELTVEKLLSDTPKDAVLLPQDQRDSTIDEILDSLTRSGLNAV